jgi:hypothetical protein
VRAQLFLPAYVRLWGWHAGPQSLWGSSLWMWAVVHRLVLKPPLAVAETEVEAVLPPQSIAFSATPTIHAYCRQHIYWEKMAHFHIIIELISSGRAICKSVCPEVSKVCGSNPSNRHDVFSQFVYANESTQCTATSLILPSSWFLIDHSSSSSHICFHAA